jgi:hypothetical protein
MTRGQLVALGISMGLMVGLLAGWVIGTTVAVQPLRQGADAMALELGGLRKEIEEARDDAARSRKEPDAKREEELKRIRSLEEAQAQLLQLQKCAAIRIDTKKENDKATYYLGDRKVELENLEKALSDLVTWDGKPDLVVVQIGQADVGDAASAEIAAQNTKKFRFTWNLKP